MSTSLEKIILHYQRDIEKIVSKPERTAKYEDRLLHCLAKLESLPIKVEHLQTTGVGKTVNSLRKINLKNGVNDAAKALVAKWKNMVIEEDDEQESTATERLHETKRIKMSDNEYSPEDNISQSFEYKPSYSTNHETNSYSPVAFNSISDAKVYSPSKAPHVSNGYSPGSPQMSKPIEVYCYSPSKKADVKKERERKGESERGSREIKSDKTKSSKSSSSHEKSSHSGSSSNKSKSSSSHSSSSSKTKDSKIKSSSSGTSSKHNVDGINSLSGASFAEALGPILVKKSSSSPKKKEVRESSVHNRSSSGSSRKSHSSSSSSSERKARPAAELLDAVSGPSHLSPLDLDVVTTLSTPTPNYRPMPQPSLTSIERRQKMQDEEDALAKIMSGRNKNSRTKVYSGVKGGYSYVPSLYELCCNVLKQNIDAMEYTGGIPYSLLKPVLDSASPTQLYQFEHYNPYIIEDSDPLWKFHVSREFRGEQREEMESWRDMYLRCVDEREQKYKAVTANIQKSIKTSVPVRQTKLAYVEVAKPPRAVIRQQQKNGTGKPEAERLMGKTTAEAVVRPPPPKSMDRPRVNPHFKPKTAPLMQKTLKSIKMARLKR